MSDAWEETTGQRRAPTYAESMARWNATRAEVAMTEQQIADKLVADRDRMRRHDAHFRSDFISAGEARLVSIALAKQLGSMPSQERMDDREDDQDMGQDD